MFKKVVVINFSGNVGKSTIAAHLLLPRIAGARLWSVETLNRDAADDGVDVERVIGKRVAALVDDLAKVDAAVVDVGASNAQDFVAGLRRLVGAHEDFDAFVVPVTGSRKQVADTYATIAAVHEMGVGAGRILVVPNRIDPVVGVEPCLEGVVEHATDGDGYMCSPEHYVFENEVFERVKGAGTTIEDVRRDLTDWVVKRREAQDDEARDRAIQMLALQRLSRGAGRNLDAVFAALVEAHGMATA